MENDSLSATVEPPALGLAGGIAAAPTVYLSARGQDTELVAAVVKARLESQGCLVRRGEAEVRTRSQCARYYGPLLHDCDVFVQLIGVDPGPLLSSEDDDDDFWSLQLWEAREAARKRKPARHYLLHDEFCHAMHPSTDRPAHVLKKQARHRRKLASSPAKVRQVRDTDELLRQLPVIRLSGQSDDHHLSTAFAVPEPGTPSASDLTSSIAPELAGETETDARNEVPDVSPEAAPTVEPSPEPSIAVEAMHEESPASQTPLAPQFCSELSGIDLATPLTPMNFAPENAAGETGSPAQDAKADFSKGEFVTIPPLPALPTPADTVGADAATCAEHNPTVNTIDHSVAVEALLPPPLPDSLAILPGPESRDTTQGVLSEFQISEPTSASSVIPPVPALPSPSDDDDGAIDLVGLDSQRRVLPGETTNANPEQGMDPSDSAAKSPASEAMVPAEGASSEDKSFAPSKESASLEVEAKAGLLLKEKIEIEVRPSRTEIVAQAPMKLELCRAEGYRVAARPYAQERRGLPRRGLPAWMLKRSEDHSSRVKPVPGKRAYVKPAQPEDGDEQDEEKTPFLDTLILPHAPPLRRYLRRTFFIFRLTDSVTVRRLGEASRRTPGIAIATGIGVVVLVGLLAKVSADFLFSGGTAASASAGSNPALASPSRLDVSAAASNHHSKTTKQPSLMPTPRPAATPAAAPATAKAGSVATPKTAISAAASARQQGVTPTGPTVVLSLDEQQNALEEALEEAILSRRRSGASIEVYARQHEGSIVELQRRIQEFIPIRNGHGFSGSPESLSLSRCLASIHLLGGRHQAARNVLLDLRDAIASSRPEGDAELRLTDHLLELTAPDASANARHPIPKELPLTPGEMDTILGKLAADPQWKPGAGGAIAGSARRPIDG